jgi:hypothetical protein
VRVAEDAGAEELEVLVELRLAVEAGARVVEVDVAAGVEAGEVGAAKLGELLARGCRGVGERRLRRVVSVGWAGRRSIASSG